MNSTQCESLQINLPIVETAASLQGKKKMAKLDGASRFVHCLETLSGNSAKVSAMGLGIFYCFNLGIETPAVFFAASSISFITSKWIGAKIEARKEALLTKLIFLWDSIYGEGEMSGDEFNSFLALPFDQSDSAQVASEQNRATQNCQQLAENPLETEEDLVYAGDFNWPDD